MELRHIALGVLVVLGGVLIVYGVVAANQSNYDLDVYNTGTEKPENFSVREFESLEPEVQDAFREALHTEGSISISESVAESESVNPGGTYVHYQDSYYRMGSSHPDGTGTAVIIYLVGGFGVIGLGSLGWYWAQQKATKADEKPSSPSGLGPE